MNWTAVEIYQTLNRQTACHLAALVPPHSVGDSKETSPLKGYAIDWGNPQSVFVNRPTTDLADRTPVEMGILQLQHDDCVTGKWVCWAELTTSVMVGTMVRRT